MTPLQAAQTAFLVGLAGAGVPADIQERLLEGGALQAALRAAFAAVRVPSPRMVDAMYDAPGGRNNQEQEWTAAIDAPLSEGE